MDSDLGYNPSDNSLTIAKMQPPTAVQVGEGDNGNGKNENITIILRHVPGAPLLVENLEMQFYDFFFNGGEIFTDKWMYIRKWAAKYTLEQLETGDGFTEGLKGDKKIEEVSNWIFEGFWLGFSLADMLDKHTDVANFRLFFEVPNTWFKPDLQPYLDLRKYKSTKAYLQTHASTPRGESYILPPLLTKEQKLVGPPDLVLIPSSESESESESDDLYADVDLTDPEVIQVAKEFAIERKFARSNLYFSSSLPSDLEVQPSDLAPFNRDTPFKDLILEMSKGPLEGTHRFTREVDYMTFATLHMIGRPKDIPREQFPKLLPKLKLKGTRHTFNRLGLGTGNKKKKKQKRPTTMEEMFPHMNRMCEEDPIVYHPPGTMIALGPAPPPVGMAEPSAPKLGVRSNENRPPFSVSTSHLLQNKSQTHLKKGQVQMKNTSISSPNLKSKANASAALPSSSSSPKINHRTKSPPPSPSFFNTPFSSPSQFISATKSTKRPKARTKPTKRTGIGTHFTNLLPDPGPSSSKNSNPLLNRTPNPFSQFNLPVSKLRRAAAEKEKRENEDEKAGGDGDETEDKKKEEENREGDIRWKYDDGEGGLV